MNIGSRLTGDNLPAAIGWVALAFAAILGTAHLLHVWIEVPSQRFGRRLKPVYPTGAS